MLRKPSLPCLALLTAALGACGGRGDPGYGGADTTFTANPKPATQAPSAEEVLARSDLPAPLEEPLEGDAMGVTVHRLSNGMSVYISTDRRKPRFAAWIAVRAGSRHDPADSTGLAHYLEHMLFKGTDELGTLDFEKEKPHLDRIAELYDELRETDDPSRRSEIFAEIDAETQKSAQHAVPNELDQLYASLGVEGLNAFTSDDQTVYIADVPSNRLEAWARVESERFADPQFRLFYPELEAVYEEKNRALDSPDRRAYRAMLEELYPNHPYGTQTTLGEIEHLKTPAFADMKAYFERWYQPNNMAIALAGDISAEEALPVLEREFARLEPKELPHSEGAPPALEGRKERVIEAEGENRVYLAWRTVDENHPDRAVLEVMDWLVNNRKSGLIDIGLVLSQKLPRAGSYGVNSYEGGHWVMWGAAREGQSHEEVEKLLLGVADKLKKGEFTQEDIDAVVVNEEISEKRALESNRSRVARMTSAFINRTPWEHKSGRLARLREVKKADVVRAANAYLKGDMVVVKRVKGEFEPPEIPKPDITPIEIDSKKGSEFAAAIQGMTAEDIEPKWLREGEDYTRHELPAGDLIAVKNERNDLFSVSYQFEIGSKRQGLLCHALELLERSGAGETSAEDLQRRLYAIGSNISTGCGADGTTITVQGLDRHTEETLSLLDAWLRAPSFDEDTVKKLAENTLSQRKDRMEEPRFLQVVLANFARLGERSSYLHRPSNREVKRARGRRLKRLLGRLPDHQHRTTYFGPRSGEEAAEAVALGKKHRKVRPREPIRYRRLREPKIFFLPKEVTQSQVRITYPLAPIDNAERVVSDLYSEYVGGGMGSLVFQEIREARGLAYSAWAYHAANPRPKDQSALFAGLGTQADKTRDALEAMLGILRRIEVEESRLATARAALEQELRVARIDPRAVGRRVLRWDDMGLDGDPRPARWEKLQRLGAAELTSFAGELAKGAPVISVMGNGARIGLEALKEQFGEIEEVEPGDLVSW